MGEEEDVVDDVDVDAVAEMRGWRKWVAAAVVDCAPAKGEEWGMAMSCYCVDADDGVVETKWIWWN